MADAIVGALLVGRGDQFRTGWKLGGGHRETADLTDGELWEYAAPFAGTLARFPGVKGVLLHDGLSEGFVAAHASEQLSFARAEVPAEHAAHERRFFAFRDWLGARPEVERVWFVDANDVIFTSRPFAWLENHAPAGAVAVGEEWHPYDGNRWFTDAWARLPAQYGAEMAKHLQRYPVNCGAMGGRRADLLPVLSEMCGHLDAMRAHVGPPDPAAPVMLDMHALAAVLLPRPPASVIPFKMDGRTAIADVPSPLLHDREPALALAKRVGVVGPDHLPDELAVRIDLSQRLPGWCTRAKAEAMARLVLDTRPALCVEIGAFGGRSAIPTALALRHNGRGKLVTVDPYTHAAAREGDQFGVAGATYWSDAELARVRAEYLTATLALDLSAWARHLDAPAERVAGAFDAESIDVLHVDGNHSAEAAVRDVRLYLPLVRPGGFVWFDDTDWASVRPALELLERGCRAVRDVGACRLYRKR